MEKEPTRQRGSTDQISQASELGTLLSQLPHQIDQVLHTPTQLIELPNHQSITFPQYSQRLG